MGSSAPDLVLLDLKLPKYRWRGMPRRYGYRVRRRPETQALMNRKYIVLQDQVLCFVQGKE